MQCPHFYHPFSNNIKLEIDLLIMVIENKILKIKRIKVPKFKVGRYSLNEYEVRNLMVEVARGERPAGLVITDENGESATLLSNGRPDKHLCGFGVAANLTIELIRIERSKEVMKY